jgi:hypothetical protein
VARLAAAAVAGGAGAGETGDALQETPDLVSRVGEDIRFQVVEDGHVTRKPQSSRF